MAGIGKKGAMNNRNTMVANNMEAFAAGCQIVLNFQTLQPGQILPANGKR